MLRYYVRVCVCCTPPGPNFDNHKNGARCEQIIAARFKSKHDVIPHKRYDIQLPPGPFARNAISLVAIIIDAQDLEKHKIRPYVCVPAHARDLLHARLRE